MSYTWRPVTPNETPAEIRLHRDGTFEVGSSKFQQSDTIDGKLADGYRIDKPPGSGEVLRLEQGRFVVFLRFSRDRWETASPLTGNASSIYSERQRQAVRRFRFWAYLGVPLLAGLVVLPHSPYDKNASLILSFFVAAIVAIPWSARFFYYFSRSLKNPQPSEAAIEEEIRAYWKKFRLWCIGPHVAIFLVAVVDAIAGSLFGQVIGADKPKNYPLTIAATISMLGMGALAALILFGLWNQLLDKLGALANQPGSRVYQTPSPIAGADETRKRDSAILAKTQAVVPWGGVSIPVDEKLGHFALVGTTRSGKTVNMQLLMQTVIPNTVLPSSLGFPRGRALVFDVKSEFVPLIENMGVPEEAIHIMNPFDVRCTPWDVATDTQDLANATSFAATLVPDPENPQRGDAFYTKTSRQTIRNVVRALHHHCKTDWTLRDLMLILRDFRLVEELLNATPNLAHFIPNVRRNAETFGNIVTSVAVAADDFEIIAACWHHATEVRNRKPISIRSWMTTNSVMVLGHDDSYDTIFRPLNRCLVRTISNSLLGNKEVSPDPLQDRTWFFLDETNDLGKLPGLSQLLTRGAGFGCSVVLGFQSIAKMQEVFGEKDASTIVGLCDNLGIFRMGSDSDTALWAAERFGKDYTRIVTSSEGASATGGQSWGLNENEQERWLITPKQIQNQLPTDKDNGLRGFFKVQGLDKVINASALGITGEHLFNEMLHPQYKRLKRFEAATSTQQTLMPWTPEELAKKFPFFRNVQADWTKIRRAEVARMSKNGRR